MEWLSRTSPKLFDKAIIHGIVMAALTDVEQLSRVGLVCIIYLHHLEDDATLSHRSDEISR